MDNLPKGKILEEALIEVLRREPEGLHIRDIEIEVASYLSIPEELLNLRRFDNRSEFGYQLAWARTHAREKGLIEKTGFGIWRISSV